MFLSFPDNIEWIVMLSLFCCWIITIFISKDIANNPRIEWSIHLLPSANSSHLPVVVIFTVSLSSGPCKVLCVLKMCLHGIFSASRFNNCWLSFRSGNLSLVSSKLNISSSSVSICPFITKL